MLNEAGDAVSEGFGLNKKQRQLIIRVLWVLGVSGHIAWVCGFMSFLGLVSPFARATDVEQLQNQVAISARLQLIQEIRTMKRSYCLSTDDDVRQSTLRYLNSLVDELRKVSDLKESPIPDCASK